MLSCQPKHFVVIVFSCLFVLCCASAVSAPNALIHESSPYLQQHAQNPVHWQPWQAAVLSRARQQQKIIFLSIGYSSCHWCHVMEAESFENPTIAAILNQHFVSIKVDREELPAVDALFMRAVITQKGTAGWPLNVFLTPEGDFFYGGSYYPPQEFTQLLNNIAGQWKKQPEKIRQMASDFARQLKSSAKVARHRALQLEDLHTVIKAFAEQHDSLQGGFSIAPKFPDENILLLFLQYVAQRVPNISPNPDIRSSDLLEMVQLTLDAMANGAIYDHVGGGFHRYTIDDNWHIPHFEKMLYNQAQLTRVYLYAWKFFKKPLYLQVARNTLNFVLTQMRQHRGFVSAIDADSRKSAAHQPEEGIYYLWQLRQLSSVLSARELEFFLAIYDVSEKGNYPEAGIGENIIYRHTSLQDYASETAQTLAQVIERNQQIMNKLHRFRKKRPQPHYDRKIITAWNAQMVSTLVLASQILQDKSYLQHAIEMMAYLLKHHIDKDTHLLWRHGIVVDGKLRTPVLASLEDYAYLLNALIDLYDVTTQTVYLDQAEKLFQQVKKLFYDKKSGVFFQNNPLQGVRLKQPVIDHQDGAMASANAMMIQFLMKLVKRIRDQQKMLALQSVIESMSDYFGAIIQKNSLAFPYFSKVLLQKFMPITENIQYAANGHLKIQMSQKSLGDLSQIHFRFTLDPDWHINSFQPLQKNLIATQLQLLDGRGQAVDFNWLQRPQAVIKKKGFSPTPLSLFEGRFEFLISVKNKADTPLWASLRLQSCSHEVCLAPQTLYFRI